MIVTNVAEQITDLMFASIDRAEEILSAVVPVNVHDYTAPIRARVTAAAETLAAELVQDQDEHLAAEACITLMPVLPEPIPPEWWSTPLGRVVARSLSVGTGEAVSYGYAALMLGIARGAITTMVTRGNLTRHSEGGVDRASLLRVWLARDEKRRPS